LAKISHAYEGAVSYHKLKEASALEITLLMDAISEIRADQDKAMKAAKSGTGGGTTIGM